jgi:hypothetical protein
MDGEHDRLVRLGAARAAIADEFWDGEPARALLRMHSNETLSALFAAVFELAKELHVGDDELLVAPTGELDAVLTAPPVVVAAVLRSRFVQALNAAVD